jgi:hypothetical protein
MWDELVARDGDAVTTKINAAHLVARLPSWTNRIAVQVTFDNFRHAIQDVYATTVTATPPVSDPVAFDSRDD